MPTKTTTGSTQASDKSTAKKATAQPAGASDDIPAANKSREVPAIEGGERGFYLDVAASDGDEEEDA